MDNPNPIHERAARRGGLTLAELMVASFTLLVMLVALLTLLSGGMQRTRTSIDEVFGSLYLAELSGQVAQIPYSKLPQLAEPIDLSAEGPHRLGDGEDAPVIELSAMRQGFTRRTLTLVTSDELPGRPREAHIQILCARPQEPAHHFELTLHITR